MSADHGPVADRVMDAARELLAKSLRMGGTQAADPLDRIQAWVMLDLLEQRTALLAKLDEMDLHDGTSDPHDEGFQEAVNEVRSFVRSVMT